MSGALRVALLTCAAACTREPRIPSTPVSTRVEPIADAVAAVGVRPPSKMPARYLRTLEYDPGGYAPVPSGEAGLRGPTDLLLGDLLFHSPEVLGPRARALGLSCNTCHPNGAAHVELTLAGLSDRPGNIDLSSSFFRSASDDGVHNPVNIPSLRGCRYSGPYGHDGRTASLAEFIDGVITVEFGGEPLGAREHAALVRYVLDLDFLPNAALDAQSDLTTRASEAARRGGVEFLEPRAGFGGKSCASCHPQSSFFRDGQVHRLGSGSPPSPHAVDGGYETPTLLGLAETAPYFHDGRFTSLAAVVGWFDETFELGLSPGEREDLGAYLEAVGRVERPRDDRPLAARLDQTFAYLDLVAEGGDPRIGAMAIDRVTAELRGEPPKLAPRVRELAGRLRELRSSLGRDRPSASLRARVEELRLLLRHLAADWAGASVARESE